MVFIDIKTNMSGYCPYCNVHFQRLGSHRCRIREDQIHEREVSGLRRQLRHAEKEKQKMLEIIFMNELTRFVEHVTKFVDAVEAKSLTADSFMKKYNDAFMADEHSYNFVMKNKEYVRTQLRLKAAEELSKIEYRRVLELTEN